MLAKHFMLTFIQMNDFLFLFHLKIELLHGTQPFLCLTSSSTSKFGRSSLNSKLMGGHFHTSRHMLETVNHDS